jgi:PKD repeat protein/photosystem II stability/assembly factor-like uncharacterized protein
MEKKIFVILLTLLMYNSIDAQEYIRLMNNQSSNFYDIQKSFNNYWIGRTQEKGNGWKQFKRWESFMEPRVYPSGKLINPDQSWREYNKFLEIYEKSNTQSNLKSANWTPLGPSSLDSTENLLMNPGLGRINAIAVNPNDSNIIYVGSPAGGCWKSINAGNSWMPLTDNLPTLGVSGIAIDPVNTNVIYLATGDGDGSQTYSMGVIKSIDGGATWQTTGLNWSTTQSRVMSKIIINPVNTNVLWAASSNGLWKTTDGGANWYAVLGGSIKEIELNPENPNTVYACTNSIFYKSTNGGNNFSPIIGTGIPADSLISRLSIAVTPNDTNYIYVLASDQNNGGMFLGLYRSIDGGNTFALRTNTPNILGSKTDGTGNYGQSWWDMTLAVSPTNKNEVYTGAINVWKSTDGGANLNAITQWEWPSGSFGYVHADIHTLKYFGNSLFCGSDGGIFKTNNNGISWTDLSNGLQITQFYRLGSSTTSQNVIIGGAQDNGSILYKNGSWKNVHGADGMECIIDAADSVIYVSTQNGGLLVSTNGGSSFSNCAPPVWYGAWTIPVVLDPITPNTIYAGYQELWKSNNQGSVGSWMQISNFGSALLNSLVVAKSNPSVIYVSNYYTIYKTTDGGTVWSEIKNGLPNKAITSIAVHDTNPNILWVTLSGNLNGEKVYKSIDGGLTWVNVSGNIPNIPINCIVYEHGSNNGVYIGTDVGVFYKDDNISNWQSYMTNLPKVIVMELEIHYSSNKIRAATFGRGMWESDLYSPLPTLPIAQFNSSNTNICPGGCAVFSDLSINAYPQWTWYFPGGSPATSTLQNPLVCYNNTGLYNVSLVMVNAFGTDSVNLLNFIEVQPANVFNVPLIEGFENGTATPTNWRIINNDNDMTWDYQSLFGAYGLSNSCIYMDNRQEDLSGTKDYIYLPALDFTNITSPELSFDIAYAQKSIANTDTLAVYYTTDCGSTKTKIWEKSGSALTTAPNIYSVFTPDSNDWRNEIVNLNMLSGMPSANLLFENRSGWGNLLYLDNINIKDNSTINIDDNLLNDIEFFPNPAHNYVSIKTKNAQSVEIVIYNTVGGKVFDRKINQPQKETKIQLNNLPQGIYLIKMISDDKIKYSRLVLI